MEINMKDALFSAASGTSEFVKSLYALISDEESDQAVSFETTITILDKDAVPLTVIRSTKAKDLQDEIEEEAEADDNEPEIEAQDTPAEAPVQEAQPSPVAPFPGYYGSPFAAAPYMDPNAANMMGGYYGMPYQGYADPRFAPMAPQAQPAPQPVPQVQRNIPTEDKANVQAKVERAPVQVAPAAAQSARKAPEAPAKSEPEEKSKAAAPAPSVNRAGNDQGVSVELLQDINMPKDRDAIKPETKPAPEATGEETMDRAEKIELLLKRYSNI